MAIKDDVLQNALKSENRPNKTSLYNRMMLRNPNNELEINLEETDNKVATNRQQTDNKQATKPTTNRQQTDNKKVNALVNWQQTGNATDNRTDNKVETNRQQTDNKPTTKASFFSLVGLQRSIMLVIYQISKISRSHITDSLTLEFIATQVKTDTKSVKTTLQRLEKKGCIIRAEYKNGRGGWSKYKLPEYIYNEMLNSESDNKLATNWQQTANKVASQPTTEPTTTAPSSSSLNTKNTTTENFELPTEWKEIDLTKLHERNVRLGKEHIIQLFPFLEKHSAFDFQESIDAFAYDIDHSYVGERKGLLNLFIGAIRNGTLYISSHYISPRQQKFNEMAELAKQRAEQIFLAWVEENRAEILKQVEAHDISLAIDFKHGGKQSLNWIRQNVYLKLKGQF